MRAIVVTPFHCQDICCHPLLVCVLANQFLEYSIEIRIIFYTAFNTGEMNHGRVSRVSSEARPTVLGIEGGAR